MKNEPSNRAECMNFNTVRGYCLSKPSSYEDFPFGKEVTVIKVANKMFALLSNHENASVSLKCEPDIAERLRLEYKSIRPGYHLNKRHWNTIDMDGSLTDRELFQLIDRSYRLVLKGLTKKERETILGIKDAR